MRVEVSSGDKHVSVRIKGHSVGKLAAAEATARRLLAAAPEPEAKPAIGFSTTSDTELAPDDD